VSTPDERPSAAERLNSWTEAQLYESRALAWGTGRHELAWLVDDEIRLRRMLAHEIDPVGELVGE
jgi:hypothetical protein